MFIENNIPNQRQGEELVLFLRRHWIIVFANMLFYAFLIFLPIAVAFFILQDPNQFIFTYETYPFILLLSSSYLLFIWLFFYNSFLDYNLDVWIITNKRIINIEQKGLFNRVISEHELEKIQDVTGIQKGFWQTFFTFGDVHVQTAAEVERFLFKQINDPFEVVKTINLLILNIRQKEEQKKDFYRKI